MRIVADEKAKVKVGEQFGRLTVLGKPFRVRKPNQWYAAVVCECECGSIVVVSEHGLSVRGNRSCGCLRLETAERHLATHGMSKTRLYKIWKGIIKRCLNPKSWDFHRYGGRGIGVCGEWMDFSAFNQWAVMNGYADHLSIERNNNDGNYEPGNCRWATQLEQSRNTRRTNRITALGETKCLSAWMTDQRSLVEPDTVKRRYYRGWSIEKALLTPSCGSNKSRAG